MSYLKTKGIVIKEVNTGEADKIITIFSKSHGKIYAHAKGARRPRSKLVACSQLLCYSDFVLFKGRDMYSINSCEVIEPFYEIRNDIVKLTYSAHLIDIINDVENQPSSRVLQLLLNTLYMLAKTNRKPELLVKIFEIRLMVILGYAPFVNGCMVCGKNELDRAYFSFKNCGIICPAKDCISNDPYAISIAPGTVKALFHIVHSRMEQLFNFDVSDEVLSELAYISRRYLRERLEKDYTKLDFLKNFNL